MKNLSNLSKFIHNKFYHTMCISVDLPVVENFITYPVSQVILTHVPCFLSKISSSHFPPTPHGDQVQYTAKIYYPQSFHIPTGSKITVTILGEERVFLKSSEEILYPSHKEIFVKRQEVVS